MKTYTFFLIALSTIYLASCSKEAVYEPEVEIEFAGDTTLEKLSEKDLSLRSGQRMYTDSVGNEYHTLVFDANHLTHVFKMTLEEGKKYRFAVLGDYSHWLNVFLLRSVGDTLFKGESSYLNIGNKNQIYWTATSGGIYYLSVSYYDDINFHTYVNRLIFEEITDFELSVSGLELKCSGDWFVNENGYLGLVMHETGTYRWAKIHHNSYNYRFSYNYTQASGYPDYYIGVDCYASDEIFDMENIPSLGYLFEVKGPSEWKCSFLSHGGGGFQYGLLNENMQGGIEYWNNISVETVGDSVAFFMNGNQYNKFRNYMSFDKGLYIIVYDTKIDTVFFKNLKYE